MRHGEVLGTRWCDPDLENGTVAVRQTTVNVAYKVRLGEDPEDIHQFRVATRRLRSDLRTFAELFPTEWVAGLRAELAWIGDRIGPVRDTDVLAGRLRAQATTLPEQAPSRPRHCCALRRTT